MISNLPVTGNLCVIHTLCLCPIYLVCVIHLMCNIRLIVINLMCNLPVKHDICILNSSSPTIQSYSFSSASTSFDLQMNLFGSESAIWSSSEPLHLPVRFSAAFKVISWTDQIPLDQRRFLRSSQLVNDSSNSLWFTVCVNLLQVISISSYLIHPFVPTLIVRYLLTPSWVRSSFIKNKNACFVDFWKYKCSKLG